MKASLHGDKYCYRLTTKKKVRRFGSLKKQKNAKRGLRESWIVGGGYLWHFKRRASQQMKGKLRHATLAGLATTRGQGLLQISSKTSSRTSEAKLCLSVAKSWALSPTLSKQHTHTHTHVFRAPLTWTFLWLDLKSAAEKISHCELTKEKKASTQTSLPDARQK